MQKSKRIILSSALIGVMAFAVSLPAFSADETVGEKAEEAINDTKRAAKKAARKVEDKTCEMVNGKMECLAKKAGNKLKDAGDKVEDAID